MPPIRCDMGDMVANQKKIFSVEGAAGFGSDGDEKAMNETIGHCQHCGEKCNQSGDRVICAGCGKDVHIDCYGYAPGPMEYEALKLKIKMRNHGHLMKNQLTL